MQKPFKLVLDSFNEIYPLLKEWADDDFWDFKQHTIIPGAVYVIGRQQFIDNAVRIRELVEAGTIRVIMGNPHEGSETLKMQCEMLGVLDHVRTGKVLLIGGGDMEPELHYMLYDTFLPQIMDYEENIIAMSKSDEIYDKTDKPYKFLFLNGRMRPHRKYLLELWRLNGLLDQTLWTSLDAWHGPRKGLQLMHEGEDLMRTVRPVKTLPPDYEVDRYTDYIGLPSNDAYCKYTLFNKEWGEIYLKMAPYVDTYFSVVTETVFDYPHSFRTEKIWKPIAIGHPWIAVANYGYYRDMHNLGFKTFGHLVDESFDQIEDNNQRLNRVSQVVEDLCRQDLPAFLSEAKETCKYNQHHLAEIRPKIRGEFPERFFQFVNQEFKFNE
jgi:hypothetical protein